MQRPAAKNPNARYAYLAPTYAQAKDAAWGYVKAFTAAIPGIEQRESDLMVRFPNGARVRLHGAAASARRRRAPVRLQRALHRLRARAAMWVPPARARTAHGFDGVFLPAGRKGQQRRICGLVP